MTPLWFYEETVQTDVARFWTYEQDGTDLQKLRPFWSELQRHAILNEETK